MVKCPEKFGDVAKTASSVLGDDFQCNGYQFKTKNKTKVAGGSAEVAVDLLDKGDVKTPAKLTFKFPNNYLEGLSINKLEMDSKGAGKLEFGLDRKLHQVDGLKLEVKSDFPCSDPAKQSVAFAATYSGVADSVVKVETKASNMADISAELMHAHDFGSCAAVLGARLENTSNLCPSAGVNITCGDLFASVVAKNQFSEFTLHKHYKVSSDMQAAATYQHGGKNNGNWAVAAQAKVLDGTAKAKFESSNNLSLSFKRDLAKGTTFVGGMKFNVSNSNMTFGAKVSVE